MVANIRGVSYDKNILSQHFIINNNQITMVIYDSTEYFDMEKEKVSEWLQLDVINMWNFSATKHCHKKASSTTIFYHLKRNVKKDKYVYTSTEVTSLTDEMKTELKNMGYTLVKPLNNATKSK